MNRRHILALALGLLVSGGAVMAEDKDPIYGNHMKSLAGKDVDLAQYKGKVLLIVNVASRCGATPQYKELQTLHDKYKDKGLAVLGFPCNQFGKQEPGSENDISEFCQKNYGVKFDMFSKVDVNGADSAPLFKHLTSEKAGVKDVGPVKWNFEKFVVGKDGKVVGRFRTSVKPDDADVVKVIEAELAKK